MNKMYVVKATDTLPAIAQAHGYSVEEFCEKARIVRPVIYWQVKLFGKTFKTRFWQRTKILAEGTRLQFESSL